MYAQNLVPNSSFEQKYDCTMAILSNAKEWCSVSNNCTYFYSCQTDPAAQTPLQYVNNCFQSYQVARTGNAYASIYGYITSSSNTPDRYAQVKLIDTLKSSKIYCVSFYLSLWNYSQYSTDKIGAVLTPTPFPCLPPATAPNYTITGVTPQIFSPAGVQLNDTLNWMEVSGTYTANGTETYLTIGDFFLQSQHSIVQSYPTNCNGVADYYLDDVSVEEVQVAKAKNDTLIYAMDSVIIGANNSEAALFSWQPSAGLSCTNCPNPKASPTITTTYTVTKTQCKAVTSDVITITVSPTGLTEEKQLIKNLFIYPNPSKDKINIKVNTTATEQFYIKLTDVLGKEIMYDKFKTELDISSLPDGIYFLSFYKNNQLLVTKKVVKQ
jgi:hypothetical protein